MGMSFKNDKMLLVTDNFIVLQDMTEPHPDTLSDSLCLYIQSRERRQRGQCYCYLVDIGFQNDFCNWL